MECMAVLTIEQVADFALQVFLLFFVSWVVLTAIANIVLSAPNSNFVHLAYRLFRRKACARRRARMNVVNTQH